MLEVLVLLANIGVIIKRLKKRVNALFIIQAFFIRASLFDGLIFAK